MGLLLAASCGSCDFQQGGLRLGASDAQMAAHDRSCHEVFRAPCCRGIQSVEVLLGFPPPEVPCARCRETLPLNEATRYRIARLSGDVFGGHRCPACGADALTFGRTGEFS